METSEKKREQRIAIAVIHGMGRQKPDFAVELQERLKQYIGRCFRKRGLVPRCEAFAFVPVYWAPIADKMQDELELKIGLDTLSWRRMRSFLIGYLGDAIAYQLPMQRNEYLVDSIHREMKTKLKKLAGLCGEDAPLCVISHSLGTVISSEYFKSVQHSRVSSGMSALAAGRTLALYYTMGSPIPIWAMRENGFGVPPFVPYPALQRTYPKLAGEWVNFYSKYDVLGFPLRGINEHYKERVLMDKHVAAGGWVSRYTPLSHNYYWENKQIIKRVAEMLVRMWIAVNEAR